MASFFRGGNGSNGPSSSSVPQFPIVPRPLIVGAAVVASAILWLFVFGWLRSLYANLLWFDNLEFRSVYTTIIITRIWLFVLAGLGFAIFTSLNVYLTYRYGSGPSAVPTPQDTPKFLKRVVVGGSILGVLVLSLIFGWVIAGKWDTILAFINASSFGVKDPQFNRDVAFYVFDLPFLLLLRSWLLGVVIVNILIALGMYFVQFSIRGAVFTFTQPVRVHLSVLGASLLFIFAFGYYLSIYGLVFSESGAVVGASYADVHARVIGLRALMVIVSISGLVLLVNAFLWHRLQMIVGVIVLWIASAVLIGVLYPNVVQRLQVIPNELEKETPYIVRNIEMTRYAFGLDHVEDQLYPLTTEATLTPELMQSNPETLDNIRLWDHRPFKDVLNQVQFFRLYYTFLHADVDRYMLEVDGGTQLRQVMLGVRELSPEDLPSEAQRWVNRKLQFTHGYGVVVAPVVDFTAEGRPVFTVKDIPIKGELEVTRPEVYYGEGSENYIIVNSNEPEFDFPDSEGNPVYTSYAGTGGIALTGFLRRLIYAWEFRDINILISGEINPASRIQYHRNIQERIGVVAPFLHLDEDPYIVIADGRLLWIQDAYLTTDRFPYSTPLVNQFGKFNYIRNSVKVVMDAYSGDLTLYDFDPEDPLIQTYTKIFPDLFKPAETMDDSHPGLRTHVRYPKDLFDIQARQYLQYHMTDPKVFFNKEDQWSVPNEFFRDEFQTMEPYYLNMRLPGETKEEFVLLLPFTPVNRENMVAWLAARSDDSHYGKLLSFEFPKGRQIDGPAQVEKRIDQEPVIKQDFTLLCPPGGAARCIRGNLLVIPMEGNPGEPGTILYAEPLYLQAGGTPFPELKRVILADGQRVVMRPNLEEALVALAGERLTRATERSVESTAGAATTDERTLQDEIMRAAQVLDLLKEQVQNLQESLANLQGIFQGETK